VKSNRHDNKSLPRLVTFCPIWLLIAHTQVHCHCRDQDLLSTAKCVQKVFILFHVSISHFDERKSLNITILGSFTCVNTGNQDLGYQRYHLHTVCRPQETSIPAVCGLAATSIASPSISCLNPRDTDSARSPSIS
jgi:hypothetical protein